ncbi:MAG: MBL fold metallo-hydrolase [Anaerotruncus sp.]|nr:MBL fold metallo-hydrolase [Anaerotruncus sp.]
MKVYTKPVGFMGTNCYIAADDNGHCVIVDPGAQPEKLIAFLEQEHLTPVYILLTHGHYDHIGGVRGLLEQYSGCKLAIGAGDADQLSDRRRSLALSPGMTDRDYLLTPDELLKEGDVVKAGALSLKVLETPGHTKGGVVYLCEGTMFAGDTLFAGDIGRCDLPGGDYRTMLASLKKLDALPGDYRVLPGHGPESTLEQERRHNQYMQMVRQG